MIHSRQINRFDLYEVYMRSRPVLRHHATPDSDLYTQDDTRLGPVLTWHQTRTCTHAHDTRLGPVLTWHQTRTCTHAHDTRLGPELTWHQTRTCTHAHDTRLVLVHCYHLPNVRIWSSRQLVESCLVERMGVWRIGTRLGTDGWEWGEEGEWTRRNPWLVFLSRDIYLSRWNASWQSECTSL